MRSSRLRWVIEVQLKFATGVPVSKLTESLCLGTAIDADERYFSEEDGHVSRKGMPAVGICAPLGYVRRRTPSNRSRTYLVCCPAVNPTWSSKTKPFTLTK